MFVLLCSFYPICCANYGGRALLSLVAYSTRTRKIFMLAQKHSSRTASAFSCTPPSPARVPGASSEILTVFAHSTTPFKQRDIVRVPLGKGGIGSENVLLQKKSDGKEGFVVLEGGVGGGLVLPSQISAKDLIGVYIVIDALSLLAFTFTWGLLCRCHGT